MTSVPVGESYVDVIRYSALVPLIRERSAGILRRLRRQFFLEARRRGSDRHYGRNARYADEHHLTEHIFVADKSDYYSINDDLPKKNHWD